ncbi:hypothetical protein FKN04_09525 [Bacillus glycinifermentans]|uniref:hypothetical protein n=1 Tax=Bacillus glycinifermentans TaxID=1664069 RepID=UPI0015841F19|nr:hypothetical protein [Bacillus glycinifermentans]NUJ16832.1 hypothetical protein [Bacillus glycinifermentans]
MSTIWILTEEGWKNTDEVLTPRTWKIKKKAVAQPIKVNEERTKKILSDLPMVRINRHKGYYLIFCPGGIDFRFDY